LCERRVQMGPQSCMKIHTRHRLMRIQGLVRHLVRPCQSFEGPCRRNLLFSDGGLVRSREDRFPYIGIVWQCLRRYARVWVVDRRTVVDDGPCKRSGDSATSSKCNPESSSDNIVVEVPPRLSYVEFAIASGSVTSTFLRFLMSQSPLIAT